MCGRYTLTVDKSTVEKHFGAKFYIAQASYDYEATYNAAPSQMLPIIRTYAPDLIELARWGFWPEEWKRSKHSRAMINEAVQVRATETVTDIPLGQWYQRSLMRKNLVGMLQAPAPVFWNMELQ
jgi:putative SOS response-associated peptidase YedK